MVLLSRTKELVLDWNRYEAGTHRIPPPEETTQQQNNMDDIFAPPPPTPTEEERNQQIREVKLSNLLSKEIGEDDKMWMKYDD